MHIIKESGTYSAQPPTVMKRHVILKYLLFVLLTANTLHLPAQDQNFNTDKKITSQITQQDGRSIQAFLDSSEFHKKAFNYETALEYAFMAYHEAEISNSVYLKTKALYAIGDRYYYNNDFSKSAQFLLKALVVGAASPDSSLLADISIDLGFTYAVNGRPDSALLHAYHALHYYKEKKEFPIKLSWCYRILGDIQYSLSNYKGAQDYYLLGAEVLQNVTTRDSATLRELSLQTGGVAMALAEEKELPEALLYYNKSDSVAALCHAHDVIVGNEYGKSYVYIYAGEYEKAINICKKAMAYYEETNDQFYLEGCWESLGRAYLYSGKLDSAEYFLAQAEASAIQNNSYEFLKEVYMLLSELYEKKGAVSQSLAYYKLYKQHTDSLYSRDKMYQMNVLEMSQDISIVEKEKQLLEVKAAQNEILLIQKERINLFITIVLGLVILSAVLLGILYYQKRNKNHKLEAEVTKRTEDLKKTNFYLQQANAELQEFAHISFHDLREPLRNITSFTKLIEKKIPKISKEELQDYISIIQFNAKQMQLLVYDVFEFVSIETEKRELTAFSPEGLVDDIIKLMDGNLKEKSASIRKNIDVKSILSNKGMLTIALRNLLENAVKYNTSMHPEIEIKMHNGENKYTWYVKDNGIGIEPQYHKRIFEMFKRLHNREKFQGSGLGLSITKKIIEKLDGEIGVFSEEGKGSTFWFSIPKVD
ncbi:MAG: ATP-binding protein [Chitinophagales bacterium]